MRCGEPVKARGQVLAQREAKPMLLGRVSERSDDVSLRSHGNCVPARLVLRIPKIESVVMHPHAAEVPCSGFLVETEQMVGIELVRGPCRNQILESNLRRMAIGFHVILVLLIP